MKSDNLIEFVFINENLIRKQIEEKKDISYIGASGGSSHGSGIGRPTERIALQRLDEVRYVDIPTERGIGSFRLSNPEKWMLVVDRVKKHYDSTVQGELIKMHYGMKMDNKRVAPAIKVSRAMFFMLRNDVISFATGVAVGLGLWVEK